MKDLKGQCIGMNINQKSDKKADKNNLTRSLLDASFQGTDRLFVLAFNNITENDNEVFQLAILLTEFKETVIENTSFQE